MLSLIEKEFIGKDQKSPHAEISQFHLIVRPTTTNSLVVPEADFPSLFSLLRWPMAITREKCKLVFG